jgi:pSer/pThr/pTyr-binding forkhead associated (FHA) protein
MYGELIPKGGGDPIPLLKKTLTVGRRESCDICLRFANISSNHCQLTVNGGYWFIKDMNSRNGIKVNNTRIVEKRLDPGDLVSIAKHQYEIRYSPQDLGAVGPPPADTLDDVMSKSLMARAGLEKKLRNVPDTAPTTRRYNPMDDRAGQIVIPEAQKGMPANQEKRT